MGIYSEVAQFITRIICCVPIFTNSKFLAHNASIQDIFAFFSGIKSQRTFRVIDVTGRVLFQHNVFMFRLKKEFDNIHVSLFCLSAIKTTGIPVKVEV